jgi:trehalose/maltose transport system substrate-binding protein
MKGRTEKYGRAGAALLLTAALLTGCGDDGAAEVSAPATDADCRTGPTIPIVLATGPDVSSGKVRDALYSAWNAHCPRHPVRVVELPAEVDGQRSQLAAAEQSGSTAYDVLSLDVINTAEFAKDGLILPLAGESPTPFQPAAWQTVTWQHHVWGVPFNSDIGLLFYRTDAGFSEPPTFWDDLKHDAKQSTLRSADARGYVTQLAPYEGLTVNALEWIWDHGGDLGGTGSHDTTKVSAGLSDLRSAFQDFMPQSVLSAHEAESLQMFEKNQATFMRGWPYMYGVLVASGLRPGTQFSVAPLPGYSAIGGQNLTVAAHSGQPALARQLIDYLTSPQSETCLLQGGYPAARLSAYQAHPPPCTALPAGASPAPNDSDGSAVDLPAVINKALRNTKARPVTPYYAAFTRLVQQDMTKALKDPQTKWSDDVDNLIASAEQVLNGKD